MIIMVRCGVCGQGGTRWYTSSHPQTSAVACRACNSTGQISVEETLPCLECRLTGKPESSLIYQDTIGQLAIWRCAFGHNGTKEVGGPHAIEPLRRS